MRNKETHVLAGLLYLCMMATASATPSSGNVSNYGAVGDGVTNDSAAFNLCLTYNVICWVDPAKTYAVGDVQMNNGNRLIGLGTVEYGDRTAATASTRPILVGVAGSTNVINVSGVSNSAAVDGLFIDCKSSSINGISGGSFQLSIQDTTVVNCAAGLGDMAGSTYTTEAHIIDATFGSNQRGISNPTDSLIINADFANNSGDGIYLGGGANSNTIVNSRFEWNQGYGVQSYGGTNNNSISNSIFDRNYKAGIRLDGVTGFTISNSVFARNGRNNVAADQNAQIYMSGAKNVSITGGLSLVGRDDGGTGTYTPAYVFSYDSGTPSTNVTISGFATAGLFNSTTNPTGSFTTAAVEGPEPTSGYNVSGVNDIADTGNTVTGITAFASGGQASATQLTATVNTVSTASAAAASVKLALCVPGRQQTVANLGANSIQVFGTSPNTINGVASATGIAQATGKIATYFCTGSGNWTRLLSN
ncbi:right-handed parallel beta-helix repeat-containing protein [Mesorhizobium sp. VK4C]|uniref:right-handed parallel beta-helix repeat-containing protein n=1 Tax=Mesorhizobium captivum TaxID=3072319 RepID=UPI002A24800B|nr:right-handed parallel beta-helix repeat-containing protein [Mesorhizobium sp. VK4C]MDX8499284.1 right-handed parallel beta-helix repeat-containing protein [Mesorhizobium sp. VK4C]